jgi:peroxiredoxin
MHDLPAILALGAALLAQPDAAPPADETPERAEREAYLDPLDPGLPVGEPVPPHALDAPLETVDHDVYPFSDFVGERYLIVHFYRGHWCGHSATSLVGWNNMLERVDELGVSLMAVSYESPELIQGARLTYDLHLPILCDTTGDLTQGFLVQATIGPHLQKRMRDRPGRNLEENHPNGLWATPAIASFLVDPEGVVRFAQASWNPAELPNPIAVLNAFYEVRAEDERRRAEQGEESPAEGTEQPSARDDSPGQDDPPE